MKKMPLATACLAVALAAFFFSSWAMSRKIEPFHTWFFCFAWWSCILVLESGLALKGRPSLLFDRPGRFALLALLSIPLWCVFELFNFRLNNWSYLNLPASLPWRWLGYALGYATVLPALGAVEAVLLAIGLERLEPATPVLVRVTAKTSNWLMAIGALLLGLSLVLPRYFFPLVWLGFIPLLDPVLFRHGQSLQGFLRRGQSWKIAVMGLAGLVCGLLWETWNFRSGAKWVYSIPFVDFYRIFEMPVLGFLGFIPFALECFVMKEAAFHLWDSRGALLRTVLALAAAAFSLLVFRGIDAFTVLSFKP